jgi:hypothetical protein
MIFIGITVFSLIGSWLGGMLDGGNMFGVWGILFGTVGGFVGIWAGFKIAQNLGL